MVGVVLGAIDIDVELVLEMAGITVSKAIAKWFEGKEMALAMGLEMAIARLGVFAVLSASPRLADKFGNIESRLHKSSDSNQDSVSNVPKASHWHLLLYNEIPNQSALRAVSVPCPVHRPNQ